MQHSSSIGHDVPKDREDLDEDGISDAAEEDFSEASEVQPQPPDAAPGEPAAARGTIKSPGTRRG